MRTPELQQRLNSALTILNDSMPRQKRRPAMKRDLTKEQFEYRAKKAGYEYIGHPLPGYWKLPNGLHVCVYNAGTRRRDWLRYLNAQSRRSVR